MHNRSVSLLTLIMLFEAALIPLSWGLSRALQIPLTLLPGLPAAALGVLATIPMWWLLRWTRGLDVAAVRELLQWVDDNLLPVFAGTSVWQHLGIAVLAGLGEELLFRGVIQQALQQWLGPWIGILLASAAFGAAHCVNRSYLVFATLMGLYLGLLYWYSGHLLVPVIVHALYDFLALRLLLGPARPVEVS